MIIKIMGWVLSEREEGERTAFGGEVDTNVISVSHIIKRGPEGKVNSNHITK